MNIEEIISAYIPSKTAIQKEGNMILFPILPKDIERVCLSFYNQYHLPLKTAAATDDRKKDGFFRVFYVFGVPGSQLFVAPFIALKEGESFPSLATKIHQLSWYEREIKTFFGINPEGHPDPRPIILHENWPGNVYPLRKDFDWQYRPPKARASYPFQRVEGEGVYEIPVGPVHAGIIEPGHFRFSVVGEEIVSLEARLGYTHKGIEKLFEVLPFEKKVMLSERVSGDSSFSHSLAYCQAVEKLGDAEVPKKALYLRVIYAELERIANHLGDIGAIMMDTAFAFGGSNGARLREIVMQWNEKLTGSRFLRGVNTVGGVTKDIPSEIKQDFKASLAALEKDFKEVIEIAEGTATLMNRLHGTGSIDRTVALDHGILGVAGKAVGIAQDTRIDFPYAAYKEMPLRMALESSGDVYARFKVRISEVLNSIEIIRHALRTMPNGDICTLSLPRLKKQSFAFSLVEGWRGDIAYFVATDEQGTITRCKVRDTSFLNWAIMGYAVTNDVVPDFPLINKSFNLSYSGNDL